MKEQVLALLCLLCPRVLALKCYECVPDVSGNCTDTQTDCPDQCKSATTTLSVGVLKQEVNLKKCAVQEDCVSGSLNLGPVKSTLNSVCCRTDLCNSQKVPALSQQAPNGKQCYFHDDNDSSATVSCEGDEDRCFSMSASYAGVRATMKGCVSRSVCSVSGSSMQAAGISGDMSCCEGNLCNSAAGVTLSPFRMLGPLLASVLFL